MLNGESDIQEAVESILDQTYEDYEFIVIDDGSTDSTPEILQGFVDPRLRVITQETQGLTKALNMGIGLSKGEYIARLDADEIAHSDRLSRQVDYLDSHPNVGLVGSFCKNVNKVSGGEDVWTYPVEDKDIREALPCRNVFVHGSVMMRRRVLDEVGLYDQSLVYVQDYELWGRITDKFKVHNLPDVLLTRKITPQSLSERPELLTARMWAGLRAQLSVMHRLGHGPMAYINLSKHIAGYLFRRLRA